MCAPCSGNEVTETSSEQSPCHLREREQEQSSSSVGVDGPDGWPSKDEVDETETPRSEERVFVVCTGGLEDTGGEEGDDVDTAHLLGKHDSKRSEGSAADTRNGEELGEASHVVAWQDEARFHCELCVDVVEIASSLQLSVPETLERLIRLGVSLVLDVPSWGF